MKLDTLYHRRFDQKLKTIEAILIDIERLGVEAALTYYKQTHYYQNRKTALILDFFHQRFC